MLWVSQKWWVLEHFAIVFNTTENLLVGISGALRMKESHHLGKMCFEKVLWGISVLWLLEHFAIVFSTLDILLVGISGALGMKENHFLSKKCDLGKCCKVPEKWWMLELSKLCHCVQHPWKFTGRDFWCSRKKQKDTISSKICFQKMLWGISEMVSVRALCHCVQHHWKLTSRDFWSSRNDRNPLS